MEAIVPTSTRKIDDLIQAHEKEGIRLDLGCGYYKKHGFIGIDNLVGSASQIETDHGPDIIMDLMAEPIPFAESSVDEVLCSHYLEHVDIGRMIEEVYRVLKPTGVWHIILPYANSAQGMYPGHFAFYTEKWFSLNKPFNDKFSVFKMAWRKTPLYDQIPERMRAGFQIDRQIYFNVCDEFTLYCHPKKEGAATPGEIEEHVY